MLFQGIQCHDHHLLGMFLQIEHIRVGPREHLHRRVFYPILIPFGTESELLDAHVFFILHRCHRPPGLPVCHEKHLLNTTNRKFEKSTHHCCPIICLDHNYQVSTADGQKNLLYYIRTLRYIHYTESHIWYKYK